MTRPLVALVSLFLAIRVRGIDISEAFLREQPMEALVAAMVQEGELVGRR